MNTRATGATPTGAPRGVPMGCVPKGCAPRGVPKGYTQRGAVVEHSKQELLILAGEARATGAHPRVCQRVYQVGVPRGCAQRVCPRGVPRGAPRGNLRYHTGSATTNVQPVWVCGCKCSAGSTGVAQGAQGHMHKAGVPTQSKGTTALVQNSCTKLVAGLSQAQGNKN